MKREKKEMLGMGIEHRIWVGIKCGGLWRRKRKRERKTVNKQTNVKIIMMLVKGHRKEIVDVIAQGLRLILWLSSVTSHCL